MAVVLPTDVEFQIPAEGKYVAFVRKGVSLLAGGAGFDPDDCLDIEVAVGEAVTNAVSHGRPTSGQGQVVVRCRLTPHRLVVEIEDEGEGLCDDFKVGFPDCDNEHGRGWILMYNLMDRTTVRCTDTGLLVRLVKRKRRAHVVRRHANLRLNVA